MPREHLRRKRCKFCKTKLLRGFVCKKKACRRAYGRDYARARRPETILKSVVAVIASPVSKSRVLEVLSCGHVIEKFRSLNPKAKRRKCPNRKCAA